MSVNEQIVTGRKFRKLIDEATKLWQRISFWTKASDVEFDDGQTAETKMGAINGITDSLVSNSSNVAASAKALSELNNKLNNQPEWIRGESGNITGYRFGGADTVFPFSNAKAGSFVSAMGEEHTIGLGFEPSFIFVYETQSGGTGMLTHWLYFSEYSTTKYFYNYSSTDANRSENIGTVGTYGGFFSIGNNVKWRNGNNNRFDGNTVHWVAVK